MQNIQNGRSCFRYNSAVYLFCPFRFIFIHFFIGTWSLLLTISVGYLLCSLYIFCTVPRGEKRSFFLSPKQCFSFAEVGSVIFRLCSPSGAAPLLLSAHQIPKNAKKKPLRAKTSEFIPILQKSLHFLCRLHNGFNCKKSFTNVYIAFASRFSALFFHILFRCCKVCITSDKKRNRKIY